MRGSEMLQWPLVVAPGLLSENEVDGYTFVGGRGWRVGVGLKESWGTVGEAWPKTMGQGVCQKGKWLTSSGWPFGRETFLQKNGTLITGRGRVLNNGRGS